MQLSESLILSQLIKNQKFRDKVMPHLKASFFDDTEFEELFKIINEMVRKDDVKVLDKATISVRYNNEKLLDNLLQVEYPEVNIKFLVKETEVWAQDQMLKNCLVESADIIKETENMAWEKAHEKRGVIGANIREALAYGFDKKLGLNFKEDIDRRFDFYNRIDEKISTGWQMFDMYTNGGLQKKTLTVAMGPSNIGKTLMGTNLTASMIMRGYKGVYLSFELQEELICRRIDSVVTKIPYYNLPGEKEKAAEIIKKMQGNAWIRDYPPSKASSQLLLNYIKELQILKKEEFDFIVADYIQLMKPNFMRQMNSAEKYKEVAEELRELGGELDLPVITFSQVQRAGYHNSDLGLSHVADAIGIINTADLVVGMTQTVDEEETSLQTWKIIKNRLGKKGVHFTIQQNSEILAFEEVIGEEERLKLNDWLAKVKTAPNIKHIRENHAVSVQEEIDDFVNYAEETTAINKYDGFN